MAASPSSSNPAPSPETLYASWRDACARREAPDFAALCAQHPALAADLRALHSAYERLNQVLRVDSHATSEQDHGRGVLASVLERLRRRRPVEPRYTGERAVSRGGMGQLLIVRDEDLRRTVAKKVILTRDGAGGVRDDALASFLEEAQITAQLTHPGVVPVHDLGVDEHGRVFYTMDLVTGRDLAATFDLARRGADGWTIVRAVGVLLRVCETLAYVHARGVVHRDLKPANVMVGAFGEVYVIDWGLLKLVGNAHPEVDASARAAPSFPAVESDRRDASKRDVLGGLLTKQGTAKGTPGYMAPEQLDGDGERIDARTDVYAVGAMLYALLSGRRPFAALLDEGLGRRMTIEDFAAYRSAVLAGALVPLETLAPEAPPELVSIARRAMAVDPNERYSGARALADDLRRYLEGRVVEAHESGAWATLRKWVLRNRALAASIAAAALASLGGAVGMALLEREGRLAVERQRMIAEIQRAPTMYAGLASRVETIWPATPVNVAALERWHADLAELRALRPRIAEALAVLEGAAGAFTVDELVARPDEGSRFESGVRGDASAPAHASTDARAASGTSSGATARPNGGATAAPRSSWSDGRAEGLRSGLAEMIRELDAGALPETWMSERLALARSFQFELPGWAERWNEARSAIAASPHYGGLQIEPRRTLMPLQADPHSGLWEFAHLLSGDPPERDPETKRWRIEARTGIVLVLIPGRTCSIGVPVVPPGHDLYDEIQFEWQPEPNPSPPFDVALDPFFIAKYELTQAQRRRAEGVDSSFWTDASGTCPADMVSWDAAQRIGERFGLVLPSEAQWEAAARAGGAFRFGAHADPSWLVGRANTGSTPIGAGGTVAVGSLEPNALGLHDMLGNVWEWALDTYDPAAAPRPGDGVRSLESSGILRNKRVLRGGSYSGGHWNARVTHRFDWERQNAEPDTGVRFVAQVGS